MAIRVSGILIVVSFIFSILTGNTAELSRAAVEGCGSAVTLTLSLVGMMCLWCGIMRVAKESGLLGAISNFMSPLLKIVFPGAAKNNKGISEISAAITANVLGIGNAATPLAVSAMKSLSDGSDTANDDMVTFTVLGTAFPSIIPTTVIALRQSCGSRSPTDILPLVWICSTCLAVFAVIICRLCAGITGSKAGKT